MKLEKSRAEDAVRMFESGYACAQAVFATYADLFGIDRETALRLGGPLSAGIGRMREVCGAVSAMAMISGLQHGYLGPEDGAAKKENYALVREMAARFKEVQGTIICREMLGLPEGVEYEESAEAEVRTPEYYASRPCSNAVRTAARLIEEMLLD